MENVGEHARYWVLAGAEKEATKMARVSSRDRDLFERPTGSGTWWIRYHDMNGIERREKAGPKGLARKCRFAHDFPRNPTILDDEKSLYFLDS